MALKTLITNAVNGAFTSVGDLAEDIIFVNKSASDYNFTTGAVTQTTIGNKTLKGIVSKTYKSNTDSTVILADVLIKSVDATVLDLDNYDTVTLRSKNWSINNVDDNGFTVTMQLARING
jgi:hypothetical protein